MRRTPKFEVFTDARGMFRWRLRAANGEIVAQSEAYPTKRNAVRAVGAVKRAAQTDRLIVT